MLFSGWGIGIRTPTNRVRVCRATVTQFPNIKLRTGFLSPASQYYTHSQSLCQPFFKNFSHGTTGFYFMQILIFHTHCAIISKQCRCSSMAECQLPKLNTGVRFPSPAPPSRMLCVREFYYIPTKRPVRITGRVDFCFITREAYGRYRALCPRSL